MASRDIAALLGTTRNTVSVALSNDKKTKRNKGRARQAARKKKASPKSRKAGANQ